MRAPSRRETERGVRWNPPDKEWLEHQYLISKKAVVAIARETGANAWTVRNWLDKAGIPRRSLIQQTEYRKEWYSGSKHHCWRGGDEDFLRKQAWRLLSEAGVPYQCERCGEADKSRLVAHHLDGNTCNNVLENLQILCRVCHPTVHAEPRQ